MLHNITSQGLTKKKKKIDNMLVNSAETINHIISECSKLAQKEY